MAEAPNRIAKNPRESTFLRASANLGSSSSTLKRTTCDVCRERKVRCDRTKPECNRCQRFGSVCTYPSPDADTERIHNTLHNLSKRLEDAERKLQQASVQCDTPISALGGQMLDLNAIEFGNLEGFPTNVGEDAEFHSWYWDQPMDESFLPDGTLLDGMPSSPETTTTATTPVISTLQQELSHEPLNESMFMQQPSPPESNMGISSISSVETCAGLYETYFNIVQEHLPLLSRAIFFRTLSESPEVHQILALKYAVCMAGAQADSAPFRLREQYYVAARYHLEQAELGSDDSSFWTVEAAQALVLVTRFESEHFTSPRATITLSRSFALMSILRHREPIRAEKGSGLEEQELDRRKIISLINLSLMFQESCGVGSSISTPLPVSSISDDIDLERLNINLLTSSQPIPENEPFGLLCVALKIAVEAEYHARIAAAVLAGIDVPSFNFSRDHERIETKIGTIVAKWLTSSSPSALSTDPNGELRALALLSALGTRIRLFNTASDHGGKSKFLNAISAECREECVSSAIDISDLLCYAQVCRQDKVTIYREANFYLMPPLRLAAEALIAALQSRSQDSTIRISHRHLEIRRSLKTIIQVMDACKPEAGTYNNCISKFRAHLVEETPLRTSFSASSSLSGKRLGP